MSLSVVLALSGIMVTLIPTRLTVAVGGCLLAAAALVAVWEEE